ncbi:MAG: hypothetical protein P0Y53_19135 [Candidatus Pseudobacter hemicellulosilyticus]|uniref:Uncharacterized protein n=1 Tax=Candidatus Pseudobacter hemicellulosilyticus TaxID=3121375 RepID=A0AAJ5WPM4_9BACT|nr:MAG: hypothetical protein P0Y53_19135 [Pseudobacter sp.]
MKKLIVGSFMGCLFPFLLFAQAKSGAESTPAASGSTTSSLDRIKMQKVYLDLNAQVFTTALPFDVPFLIVGEYDSVVLEVKGYSKEGIASIDEVLKTAAFSGWNQRTQKKDPFILLYKSRLKPNKEYTFVFQFIRLLYPEELAQIQDLATEKLNAFLKGKIDRGLNTDVSEVDINGVANVILLEVGKELKKKGLEVKPVDAALNYGQAVSNAVLTISDNLQEFIKTPLMRLNNQVNYHKGKRNNFIQLRQDPKYKSSKQVDTIIVALEDLSDSVNTARVLTDVDREKYQEAITSIKKLAMHPDWIAAGQPDKNISKAITTQLQEIVENLPEIEDRGVLRMSNYQEEVDKLIKTHAASLAKEISSLIYYNIHLSGTTHGDFEARGKYYFSADIGVAFTPAIGRATPYLGTNIYLRPVNKERPLLWSDPFWDQLGRRFSLLAGISYVSVSKSGKRSDLLGNTFNLLAGGGFRINDGFRINGGWLFYNEESANPLIDKNQIVGKPFVALSFDVDINSVFKTVFGTTVPNK